MVWRLRRNGKRIAEARLPHSLGRNRRVMMRNLPITIDPLPHIREARLDRGASTSVAKLESVEARVQICVAVTAVDLNGVVCDGTVGIFLDEIDKVCLGAGAFLDVLGRDGGQERKIAGVIESSNLFGVLGLQGVVPALEVGLQACLPSTLDIDTRLASCCCL